MTVACGPQGLIYGRLQCCVPEVCPAAMSALYLRQFMQLPFPQEKLNTGRREKLQPNSCCVGIHRIKIAQFNVLADSLATADSFPLAASQHLNWSNRTELYSAEVQQINADFIGMEVWIFNVSIM